MQRLSHKSSKSLPLLTRAGLIGIIGLLLLPISVLADTLALPARAANAQTGSQLKEYLSPLSLSLREEAIYTEITSGNVPTFLRTFIPITITSTLSGQSHTVSYQTLPEYFALGTDTDYFLMPMSPLLAQKVADFTGCSMPTRKMVNDIWKNASVKMNPTPIAPSAQMITIPVFYDHNTIVRKQRETFLPGQPMGTLTGGHKKDVVITKLLATTTAKVAIYGWHYPSGSVIQNLYLGHEDSYADYSHGIRLIKSQITLDGNTTTLQQVLKDATYCWLLSDEGTVTTSRYPIPEPARFPLIDSFPSTGRELDSWTDKFTQPAITSFTPNSPGGDGYALVVKDPSGGMETTRTGSLTDKDYFIQCHIYCLYRPELASDGYERCGIFLRDNGNGSFEHTTGGGGYCYAMAWDSNNGRLWCLKSVNGALTDLNSSPLYYPSSGWRNFRIEALGNQIKFLLDGTPLLTSNDTTFSQGQCGIGFHEYFTTNSNMRGTYADNFMADAITASQVSHWELY